MTDYTDIASVVVTGESKNVVVPDRRYEIRDRTIRPEDLAADVTAPLANVTFHADGSITDSGSIPTTTTFNADGSITTVYGAPTNRTVVTTFNADGTITEVTA